MQILAQSLGNLKIGTPRSFAGLTVHPLLGDDSPKEDRVYRTLDEALAAGAARVTEIDAGGSVPELSFVNDGDLPVLLLDGEELVGAKQNRVLNLTILAPAGKTIVVPVSCVEAGRWAAVSEHLSSANHVMYAVGRGRKYAQVSSSLKAAGTPRSDQGRVWGSIDELAQQYGVHSPTSKLQDVVDSRREQIDDYVRAFEATDRQVGAAFALAGRIRGVELFDHQHTLRGLLPKLVRSWAMDAMPIARQAHEVPPPEAVRSFLEDVGDAETSSHPGVGLGEDVRLTGRGLAGGALVHDGRVVHLCAFRLDDEEGHGRGDGYGSRMARASWRRNRR